MSLDSDQQHCDNNALRTVLYDRHLALAGKNRIQPFAGHLLPLWFSNIAAEHKAVRTHAGLFDVTHMGIIAITGSNALAFLNFVTTNNVSALTAGRAQYSYILDQDGSVLDDVIVYCLANDNYMLVVNAANDGKIQKWLAILLNARPDLKNSVTTRYLRNQPDGLVDLALQGPASIDLLKGIIDSKYISQLNSLKPFEFFTAPYHGRNLIIARTGYTGSLVGFEIFVAPSLASQLWDELLHLGAIPCGLGSRDSLRIEAGLPLYGHELEGPENISPFQAGYPWAVKLDKTDFVGKAAIVAKTNAKSRIMRLTYPGQKGIRPVRIADAVLDRTGRCIGHITSAATIDERQIALALIASDKIEIDHPVGLYYAARNAAQLQQGRLEKVELGTKLPSDLEGMVLPRFVKF